MGTNQLLIKTSKSSSNLCPELLHTVHINFFYSSCLSYRQEWEMYYSMYTELYYCLHQLQCPVLLPQEEEPLAWFLSWGTLTIRLLPVLALLPFSLSMASLGSIYMSLSTSFFQSVATTLLTLILWVDSWCWFLIVSYFIFSLSSINCIAVMWTLSNCGFLW